MSDSVFFDTNILVYAHDNASPAKKTKSQELLFQGLRAGTGVISPQVLSEFFVTVTRKLKKPLSVRQARTEVELLSVMATVDLDATLVMSAIDNKMRWQLSYWGALIIAAAKRSGASTVYSEDMSDGQSYGTVTVRNPYRRI